MKKLSLRSIVLGSGIALFVPLICFFILRGTGHTGHVKVPGNYVIDTVLERTVEGKKVTDTIYHTIQDNAFINHLNDTANLATDFTRKMLLINFIDTRGVAEDDKRSGYMGHIQQGFKLKKTDTALQLISVSVNPDETLSSLRDYANRFTNDHDTWDFLMGNLDTIAKFARTELGLSDIRKTNVKLGRQNLVLVDKYRNIRGYYNTNDSMRVKHCIDDIAVMMVEKNKIHEKKKR